jgi:predicted amidohydrolase
MVRKSQNPTEPAAKDAGSAATADFDAFDETPIERFKALTRRLLRVSPQELAKERERHAASKDQKSHRRTSKMLWKG